MHPEEARVAKADQERMEREKRDREFLRAKELAQLEKDNPGRAERVALWNKLRPNYPFQQINWCGSTPVQKDDMGYPVRFRG